VSPRAALPTRVAFTITLASRATHSGHLGLSSGIELRHGCCGPRCARCWRPWPIGRRPPVDAQGSGQQTGAVTDRQLHRSHPWRDQHGVPSEPSKPPRPITGPSVLIRKRVALRLPRSIASLIWAVPLCRSTYFGTWRCVGVSAPPRNPGGARDASPLTDESLRPMPPEPLPPDPPAKPADRPLYSGCSSHRTKARVVRTRVAHGRCPRR
jgi:hypothetical protein